MSTKSQLEAERFLHRALNYLKTNFPEKAEDLSENILKDKLISSCQTAWNYGFETQIEMMMIVDFLWRLPVEYTGQEEYKWIEEIMSSKDMDNKTKIDTLHHTLQVFNALK